MPKTNAFPTSITKPVKTNASPATKLALPNR